MRIFAAILLGILVVTISVFYSVGAFAPLAPLPPVLFIHGLHGSAFHSGQTITLTAESGDGYQFTPWLSPIKSGDRIDWSKDCASYVSYIYVSPDKDQHDLATRIERLQAQRLALPPLPISGSIERDNLKKRYEDLDKRIKRLQDLRDDARTILSKEDLLVNIDTSKEESQAKTTAGPSDIPPQRFTDDARPASPATHGPRRAPPVAPIMVDEAKKPTIFTPVTDATRRFFDYLLAHPHDALDDFWLALFYYLVLLFGIITGTIYDALGTHHSGPENVPFKALLAFITSSASWQGILASPIVFAVIKGSMPSSQLSLGMTLLAFQNGFFWRATLRRIELAVERRAVRKGTSVKNAK